MKKLFIDSNVFLDFYRLKAVKSLLKPLSDVVDHIVVTKQVVDEVLRNRVEVARDLLAQDLKFSEYKKPTLPDFLTQEAVKGICSKISTELEECKKNVDNISAKIASIYDAALIHVAKGEDNISSSLAPIFEKALSPTQEQISRARIRKEFGNPPGKKTDPIGDQITWEQLIDYAQENKCEIWVVSKDEDYYTKGLSSTPVPNSYLLAEFKTNNLKEFRFFLDISTALTEFKASEKADLELPGKDALEEARKAQQFRETECIHEPTIIQNGRFDVVVCAKCHKHLHAYLADFD